VRIDFIQPLLPPVIDGIGDYTALLSAELSQEHRVRILVDRDRSFAPIPGVEIVPGYRVSDRQSFRQLHDLVDADWTILQYNPFGYGRRGYNPVLPGVMKRLAESGKTRVAMMSHETYTPFYNLPLSLMALYQRPQFRRLLRASEVTWFSMENRVEPHRSWAPGRTMLHLPVGSNIPPVPIDRQEARRRLGLADDEVVLGVFGQAHVSRSLDLVGHAARAMQRDGRKVRLLYLGPDGNAFAALFPDLPSTTEGPLPADEVSRRLAAMDVFLATYGDGICARRGAFIAALQHGLPIAATIGPETDSYLAAEDNKAYLMARFDRPDDFAAIVRRLVEDRALAETLRHGALDLFDRVFAWPRIAQNLIQSLQLVS
jgi:glycosyltransferase involved in cell wall biosynthesis